MRGLLAPAAGNRIHVAAIADPEVTSALEINDARVRAGLDSLILVSADTDLNAAARADGVGTEDPNTHP